MINNVTKKEQEITDKLRCWRSEKEKGRLIVAS